eukprot:1037503-Heterocapsa_arctica.AAC.1
MRTAGMHQRDQWAIFDAVTPFTQSPGSAKLSHLAPHLPDLYTSSMPPCALSTTAQCPGFPKGSTME